ncbi:MAG: 2-C-methyl-D-erythritol 4-phosphate cytidylyltransferase [Flavobacteriales bacterium]|nr:2-C-methyl-D-erythritol 4-phosphate cytidylyltransferase [Flavobacteriales bacterium]
MERSTIIVAGGSGKRMAQFMLVKGKPVLCHVISAFHLYDPAMQIIVVLPKEQIDSWRVLCIGHGFTIDHTVVAGGEERFHSVREGLKEVAHDGLVAVHDGVRPLVSLGLIERCFAAAELHDAAIPVVPVSSSMRELTDEGSRALDRSRLRIVQTPQCFQVELLRKAFKLPYDPAFTDEATLVERMGNLVRLVEGDERNIKVTTPDDLVIAAALLEEGR